MPSSTTKPRTRRHVGRFHRTWVPLLRVMMLCALGTSGLEAADWFQWRGPRRDGVSTESNLLRAWPQGGPRLLWSASGAGPGYSSPSIANGRVYVTGGNEKEKLTAFDLQGRLQWTRTYGKAWTQSFPDARSTPTVIGDRVYVISGAGEIACLDVADGRILWSLDAMEQYGGRPGPWGTAESPLIVGDKLIYTPGGAKTAVVALDRGTGQTSWMTESLDDQGGYVSPIAIEIGGRTQIVAMTGNYVLGVDAETGAVDWQVRFGDISATENGGGDITTNTPLHRDGRLFVTSGYDHAGVMIRLARDGKDAQVEWVQPVLDNHHGHVVLVGGHLYGSNWLNNKEGHWACLDWQTGKPAYEAPWMTKGAIIAADGMLYCYDERRGHLALVKATPDGFQVVSSFRVELGDGPHWSHPAISNGVLYVRHGNVLMAYDIKARATARR